jgi:hypothetical protein
MGFEKNFLGELGVLLIAPILTSSPFCFSGIVKWVL